jgi:hypothetical protein
MKLLALALFTQVGFPVFALAQSPWLTSPWDIHGEIYYKVSNPQGQWAHTLLYVNWEKKTGRFVYDYYVQSQSLPMTVDVQSDSHTFCLTLRDHSRGLSFPYCEFLNQADPTGQLVYLNLPSNPTAQDRLHLDSLYPQHPQSTHLNLGGVFRSESGDEFLRMDPVTQTLTRFDACHPDGFGERGFSYGNLTPPGPPVLAQLRLDGGRIYSYCSYPDKDHLVCGTSYVRTREPVLPTCSPAPTPTSDPAHWPNAVVGPDGTIWSDAIGVYQNCNSSFADRPADPGRDYYYYSSGACWQERFGDGTSVPEGEVAKPGILQDTPAARACARIGGKLPTLEQFKTLPKDPKYWPKLQISYIHRVGFWTADVSLTNPWQAGFFIQHGLEQPGTYPETPIEIQFPILAQPSWESRSVGNYVRCVDR